MICQCASSGGCAALVVAVPTPEAKALTIDSEQDDSTTSDGDEHDSIGIKANDKPIVKKLNII